MTKNPLGTLIGRSQEIKWVRACVQSGRNVLLEGPVGVGKTHLALAVASELKRSCFRIDGDSRYSEQKLAGWFDPPTVIKKGFLPESFIPGPLVEAMRSGSILFINELNRLPEGVQNILLPAIDEGILLVPRLGVIQAVEGFLVIATQNPKEFVATSHLSEAILDRFELITLDYQSEVEEVSIVSDCLKAVNFWSECSPIVVLSAVRIVRHTRDHPRVKRGASIRAAIAIAEIASTFMKDGAGLRDAVISAALLALPTRIEIERDVESDQSLRKELESLTREMAQNALDGVEPNDQKKKV